MKPYLDYIRSKPCLICGQTPCDPDHLEARGMGGAGDEMKDYSCVPLCRSHHMERHSFGIDGLQKRYSHLKLNLWKDAFRLYRDYKEKFCRKIGQ